MLLRELIADVEARYPPPTAHSWDAVGLTLGDPDVPVRSVLLAVDPALAVAEEAVDRGVDLVVTHHPLFLKGVHGFAATTAKGRTAHLLSRHGIALYTAHTNADDAPGGVSESLARAVGLTDLRPLAPAPEATQELLVAYVPSAHTETVLDALAAAGAGAIGEYSRCAWGVLGQGTFVPGAGASPSVGLRGRIERVDEQRLEVLVPPSRRREAIAALRSAHPYSEPAFHLLDVVSPGPLDAGARGSGRIGRLPEPVTLREYGRHVAGALPATAQGIRLAGDLDALITTVAVCGGSGDAYLGRARAAGVDAYLTADLRHHPASEFREEGGPALIDAAHWASEWPWLPALARQLTGDAARRGATLSTHVSNLATDAWTARCPSDDGPAGPASRALEIEETSQP